jgi:hypothetical protein
VTGIIKSSNSNNHEKSANQILRFIIYRVDISKFILSESFSLFPPAFSSFEVIYASKEN